MPKITGESPSDPANPLRREARLSRRIRHGPRDGACRVSSTGHSMGLKVRKQKSSAKKYPNAALRCDCGHPKSIHSRMYANPKLGTACNFPSCRCKAYKAI
jgi:hypothetical protein